MTSTPPLPPEAPAADATFVPPPAPVVAAPFEQLGLAAPAQYWWSKSHRCVRLTLRTQLRYFRSFIFSFI